jgi:hypothetical protein
MKIIKHPKADDVNFDEELFNETVAEVEDDTQTYGIVGTIYGEIAKEILIRYLFKQKDK